MASLAVTRLHDWWVPLLLAISLVLPIFIDPVLHQELFLSLILVGLTGAGVAAVRRGQVRSTNSALFSMIGMLLAYLCVRTLLSPQPLLALSGAYGSDNSLLSWVAMSAAFTFFATRGPGSPESMTRTETGALGVILAYAAASSIAAWQWGSTDGVGGPPSGFTPNSQYQLQLLVLGLAAGIALLLTGRRDPGRGVLVGAGCVVIVAGIIACRSSVAPLALTAGATYALLIPLGLKRVRLWVIAALSTTLIALAILAMYAALLTPSVAPRTVSWLDTVGNGRGALWASAARVTAQNPIFGRGLDHFASVTRWELSADSLDATTTTDPHNLFLTLGMGGGIGALLLALGVLFALQHAVLGALLRIPEAHRTPSLVVVAAAVTLFLLAQFAFVYAVAWTLAAALLGTIVVRGWRGTATPGARGASPPIIIALAAATAALLLFAWMPLPGRAGSLHLSRLAAWTHPGRAVESQLALVEHSWDVMPAGSAADTLAVWLRTGAPDAWKYVPLTENRLTLVVENMKWDARLTLSSLLLWDSMASHDEAGTDALIALADAGIEADPASALWATVACTRLARAGKTELATEYASRLRADALWSGQLDQSADAATVALVDELLKL